MTSSLWSRVDLMRKEGNKVDVSEMYFHSVLPEERERERETYASELFFFR